MLDRRRQTSQRILDAVVRPKYGRTGHQHVSSRRDAIGRGLGIDTAVDFEFAAKIGFVDHHP